MENRLDIDESVDTFLKETRVGVLGTLGEYGLPHLVPIWFSWNDGSAYMFTSRRSIKWNNIAKNPKAALCVDHKDPPYAAVTIYGYIKELDEPIYQNIKSMAVRYLGPDKGNNFAEAYKDNPNDFVPFRLIPENIHWNLKIVD